jgi:hypothetical protein
MKMMIEKRKPHYGGTYETYTGEEAEWRGRLNYSADGNVYLIMDRSALNLPQFIELEAKGYVILDSQSQYLRRRVERGYMTDPHYGDGSVMAYWYFLDDKGKSPIKIRKWPFLGIHVDGKDDRGYFTNDWLSP